MENKEYELVSFNCVDNFKDYNHPLMFTEGDNVAEAVFLVGEKEIVIEYHVYGDAMIDYKGEIYRNCPDDYPKELKKIILADKEYTHEDVNVLSNTWVEISSNCVEILDFLGCDGAVLDALPDTKEQILEDMEQIIKDYIEDLKQEKQTA